MAVTAGLGLTAMLLVGVGSVGAAPGDLDTTFSSDGSRAPAMSGIWTKSL